MEKLRLILKIVKAITEIFLIEIENRIERRRNEYKLEEHNQNSDNDYRDNYHNYFTE